MVRRSLGLLGRLSAYSVEEAAARIEIERGDHRGFRTIIAPAEPFRDAMPAAEAVACALADRSPNVLLIECTVDTLSSSRPVRTLVDCARSGSFEGAIAGRDGTSLQVVETGDCRHLQDWPRLQAAVDALDDVYELIVMTGSWQSLAAFFEAIDGRVDFALEVGGRPRDTIGHHDRLLGFDVVDLTILSVSELEG